MNRRLGLVISAGLALSGCSTSAYRDDGPTLTATTIRAIAPRAPTRHKARTITARKDPAPHDEKALREAALAKFKPYSQDWWTVQDAIDRAEEADLAKKLVICRGCLSPNVDDETGSILLGTPR